MNTPSARIPRLPRLPCRVPRRPGPTGKNEAEKSGDRNPFPRSTTELAILARLGGV